MAEYRGATIPRRAQYGDPEPLQFPGCRPVRISRDEIGDYEGRIEYWSADTEVAMVCEPVSVYHEHPPQRLVRLADRIAQTRGSPIETFGAADLLVRDTHGRHLRILQADQTVYLRPRTARPWGPAIEVGSDQLPDVVLEVDNTTDVLRGKLGIYESWGFPEVWVEVPDTASPSRPAGLRPGLTIYLLGDEGFPSAPTSRALPGWSAEEIYLALNEPELSGATAATLSRVGRALGVAAGTGPDDDPFLHAERQEGRTEGRMEAANAAVLQVLETQVLHVSATLSRRLAGLENVSTGALVQAALE